MIIIKTEKESKVNLKKKKKNKKKEDEKSKEEEDSHKSDDSNSIGIDPSNNGESLVYLL